MIIVWPKWMSRGRSVINLGRSVLHRVGFGRSARSDILLHPFLQPKCSKTIRVCFGFGKYNYIGVTKVTCPRAATPTKVVAMETDKNHKILLPTAFIYSSKFSLVSNAQLPKNAFAIMLFFEE